MDLYHQVSNTVYFLFLFCDWASCFCTSVKHSFFFLLSFLVVGGEMVGCVTE